MNHLECDATHTPKTMNDKTKNIKSTSHDSTETIQNIFSLKIKIAKGITKPMVIAAKTIMYCFLFFFIISFSLNIIQMMKLNIPNISLINDIKDVILTLVILIVEIIAIYLSIEIINNSKINK